MKNTEGSSELRLRTPRMKRPASLWYWGDWRRDTALQSCSIGARGTWIEMLCVMHDGEPYGHLRVGSKIIDPPTLAAMIGVPAKDLNRYLAELEGADVFSRDVDGCIFSRRMVRDEETRRKRAVGGASSLNNPNVPRPKEKP